MSLEGNNSPGAASTIVYAWGCGEDGQLGLGIQDDQPLLQRVTALDHVQVYVWGWNQRGTLGHPGDKSSKFESIPSQVKGLAGKKIVQASIGGWHCLAVDDKGSVYAWGGNEYGQCAVKMCRRDIPIPQPCAPQLRVRQVAAGGTHSVVLTVEGEVWTWGQPWPPGDNDQIWKPLRVMGLSQVAVIAVGAFHNLALLESGEVHSWGLNEYGQLGTGDTQPRSLPGPIPELASHDIVDVAAGGWHSVAITRKGQVWAWGRGEHGRLGFGDDKSSKVVPHSLDLLACEHIVQVTCGGTHSVALTKSGQLYTFGRCDHGRLGHLNAVTSGHPVLIDVEFPKGNSQWRMQLVASGGRHTLALATSHPREAVGDVAPRGSKQPTSLTSPAEAAKHNPELAPLLQPDREDLMPPSNVTVAMPGAPVNGLPDSSKNGDPAQSAKAAGSGNVIAPALSDLSLLGPTAQGAGLSLELPAPASIDEAHIKILGKTGAEGSQETTCGGNGAPQVRTESLKSLGARLSPVAFGSPVSTPLPKNAA